MITRGLSLPGSKQKSSGKGLYNWGSIPEEKDPEEKNEETTTASVGTGVPMNIFSSTKEPKPKKRKDNFPVEYGNEERELVVYTGLTDLFPNEKKPRKSRGSEFTETIRQLEEECLVLEDMCGILEGGPGSGQYERHSNGIPKKKTDLRQNILKSVEDANRYYKHGIPSAIGDFKEASASLKAYLKHVAGENSSEIKFPHAENYKKERSRLHKIATFSKGSLDHYKKIVDELTPKLQAEEENEKRQKNKNPFLAKIIAMDKAKRGGIK